MNVYILHDVHILLTWNSATLCLSFVIVRTKQEHINSISHLSVTPPLSLQLFLCRQTKLGVLENPTEASKYKQQAMISIYEQIIYFYRSKSESKFRCWLMPLYLIMILIIITAELRIVHNFVRAVAIVANKSEKNCMHHSSLNISSVACGKPFSIWAYCDLILNFDFIPNWANVCNGNVRVVVGES